MGIGQQRLLGKSTVFYFVNYPFLEQKEVLLDVTASRDLYRSIYTIQVTPDRDLQRPSYKGSPELPVFRESARDKGIIRRGRGPFRCRDDSFLPGMFIGMFIGICIGTNDTLPATT